MLRKRLVMLFSAVVWTAATLCPWYVSFAQPPVKPARDLIRRLAPPPPAKPVRRARGLAPPPVVPVRPIPKVVPRQVPPPHALPLLPRPVVVPVKPIPQVVYRQVPPPPTVPVIPRQEVIQYPSVPPPLPLQEPIQQPNIRPVQVVQTPPSPTRSVTLSAVQFIYDSEELLPVARRQLDELVIALRDTRLRHSRIQLIGHTDAAGSRAYNRALSMRRAYSAARYLTQVHGISPQRIIPIGMGEDQLLDPYNPLSAVNRRVEITVVN
ncbi:MAG: OmpA family protein [Candidatus Electrothrix communis]|nr:MAG: OmpA family protein [Candidatus Electrothrix communis]